MVAGTQTDLLLAFLVSAATSSTLQLFSIVITPPTSLDTPPALHNRRTEEPVLWSSLSPPPRQRRLPGRHHTGQPQSEQRSPTPPVPHTRPSRSCGKTGRSTGDNISAASRRSNRLAGGVSIASMFRPHPTHRRRHSAEEFGGGNHGRLGPLAVGIEWHLCSGVPRCGTHQSDTRYRRGWIRMPATHDGSYRWLRSVTSLRWPTL